MGFKNEMAEKRALVDDWLDRLIPPQTQYPQVIYEAMRYSVFVGGKRLRPVMLIAVCEMLGGDISRALPFACAIEMIHTYSLIHDDLPALDNDDYRRGRLTSHKQFGEDIAILAGDALLGHAFEIMSGEIVKKEDINLAKAMNAIAIGAGVNGMLTGQVVDVISEGKKIDKSTLDFIHLNKTAAMIQGAFKAGAYIAGSNEQTAGLLSKAAEKIGVAFQIQDDILDVTGTFEEIGKPVLSDEKNDKTTYVTLFGIEASAEIVKRLSEEACSILSGFGGKSGFMVELVQSLTDRRN
ncbi:polyprenyl synthetase family protein [Lachnospiraceae bacterium NSJ-143]|nr:polyprenyl synthetase family protein [Lachnospiraceae bacterium NSJ-143]